MTTGLIPLTRDSKRFWLPCGCENRKITVTIGTRPIRCRVCRAEHTVTVLPSGYAPNAVKVSINRRISVADLAQFRLPA